jgi:hypothetical protein
MEMSLLLNRCVDKPEEILWMYHIHRKQKVKECREDSTEIPADKRRRCSPQPFHLPKLFYASCVVM